MKPQNSEINLDNRSTVGRTITIAFVLFALAAFSSVAQAATFHVTTTVDNGNNNNDANPDDPQTIQQSLDGKINAVLTITDSDGDPQRSAPEWVREPLARFSESEIERWGEAEWEAFALEALWGVCCEGATHAAPVPPAMRAAI